MSASDKVKKLKGKRKGEDEGENKKKKRRLENVEVTDDAENEVQEHEGLELGVPERSTDCM
jgi:hypothetical protein